MAHLQLETPSRIMRRIELRQRDEMPSLPSIPFEEETGMDDDDIEFSQDSLPVQSTPSAAYSRGNSTVRPPSSTSSTVRFANSITSRSTRSGSSFKSSFAAPRFSLGRQTPQHSFDDVSIIPPPLDKSMHANMSQEHDLDLAASTRSSEPDAFMPPELPDPSLESDEQERDLSIVDALESVSSRSSTPPIEDLPPEKEPTPRKKGYDYPPSLRTEPKPSPFDKFRNISLRRPPSRNRTPSLTHTASPTSSPENSTPHSTRSYGYLRNQYASPPDPAAEEAPPVPAASIPLPRSRTASPAFTPRRYQSLDDSAGAKSDLRKSPSVQSLVDQSTHEHDEDLIRSPVPPGVSTQELPEHVEESEPTFSSEGTPAPKLDSPAAILGRNSPGRFGVAPSSPVPSITFTPTPAFQARPRPRPRFGGYQAAPPTVEESEESLATGSEFQDKEEDLTELPKEQEGERTPTTRAPSRLRARFNADPVTPAPVWDRAEGSQTDDSDATQRARPVIAETPTVRFEDDLATPAVRRKSFLLSVVNSTTRPRMKMGTPMPPKIMEESASEETESEAAEVAPPIDKTVEATPAPGKGSALAPPPVSATPAMGLVSALSGVTPLPRPRARPRLSHPLAQAWTSNSSSRSPPAALTASSHSPQGTPLERASFISTASSHDLTTHARANASFDPVMGLTAQGHGVGRFNAGKLNSYLHGLNRRLQQENEDLMTELNRLREERATAQDVSVLSGGLRARRPRLSGGSIGSRRSSVGGNSLGDVEERGEEKAAFEEKIDDLKKELVKLAGERDLVQHALEDAALEREQLRKGLEDEHEQLVVCQRALQEEEGARAEAKKEYKERVRELEKGIEGVVKQLEDRAAQAEAKTEDAEKERDRVRRDLERMLADLEGERALATERAEKAEMALESGRGMDSELKEANERITQVMAELRAATAQIRDLEDDVMRASGKVEALDSELKEARNTIRTLEDDVQRKWDELADARTELDKSDKARVTTEEQLSKANVCIAELEADAGAALGRIQTLEQKLLAAEDKFRVAEEVVEEVEDEWEKAKTEADRANELARQMEDALEVAEKKMQEDEARIVDLKAKIASLERDRDRSVSQIVPDHGAEIEALEAELDDAHREIARLTAQVSQSPARKAIEHAKDAKIELLEREKEDLLERVKSLKSAAASALNTPSKISNFSGISPAHRHVLNMSLRTPKTPGAPLRDLTWLNQTTADPSVAPLLAEINRLQRELDHANESVDDKLDKLEDAGLGVIGLTKKLEDARIQVVTLEDEVARLNRREERRRKRLEKARCLKCRSKVDLRGLDRQLEADESSDISESSLLSEPSAPSGPSTDVLQSQLRTVNAQLEAMKIEWSDEKRRLLGEKAALQDAAQRLNAKIRETESAAQKAAQAEAAGKKARSSIEAELTKAKEAIAVFEAELKSERARLRDLSSDQGKAEREKADVLLQLKRTESDIEDVKVQLQKAKQENHDLERELRVNANAEQKARLLEVKVTENQQIIDQLREERLILATNHKDLEKRFAQASEAASKIRDKHAASQTSHDNRRQQLDLQLAEIDELRAALSSQADELHHTESEKRRMAAERTDVSRTVSALESDLARVRREAEAFGRDLKALRAEKERAEEQERRKADEARKSQRAEREARNAEKEALEQTKTLMLEVKRHKEEARAARREREAHVCAGDGQLVSTLKLQHNKECKGLIVQIRYLKAKFTRESLLRCDLGYQKHYLLVLLSQFEKSEKRILASIAKIGFPSVHQPRSTRKRRTLKSIATSVLFIVRARRASEDWREKCRSKTAIAEALQEVRQRRVSAS